MNGKICLKSVLTALPALAALLLAAALLTACAGKAPSLGKPPTQDAQAFYEEGQTADYNGDDKTAVAAYTKAVRGGSPLLCALPQP